MARKHAEQLHHPSRIPARQPQDSPYMKVCLSYMNVCLSRLAECAMVFASHGPTQKANCSCKPENLNPYDNNFTPFLSTRSKAVRSLDGLRSRRAVAPG